MRRRRQGRSFREREPAIDLNIVREVVLYVISTFIAVLAAVVAPQHPCTMDTTITIM